MMASLQLHQSIYDRAAVEQTVQAFDAYGTYNISQSADSEHLTVDIEPTEPSDTDELLGLFANYALSLSIDRHRSRQ
jgi:hypothetical protein